MDQPFTGPQTILGEPLDQFVVWNLKYWLNIYVIGTMRLQDATAMEVRIQIENQKARQNTGQNYFSLSEWSAFKQAHEAEYREFWQSIALEHQNYQTYVHDLDQMLVDKDAKMFAFLRPKIESARHLTGSTKVLADNWLHQIRRGLVQERRTEAQAAEREAEAHNRVPREVNREG